MKVNTGLIGAVGLAVLCLVLGLFFPTFASAHCDTMDGPVVMTARMALEKGDVTPVLKWVKKDYEKEIGDAFKKTLAVRSKGPEAKELADMYFFETLVRIHRAGEGVPYEGLKPSGTELNPAVTVADFALANNSVDSLIKLVSDAFATGIRRRFNAALEKKKHSDESVKSGREFVKAYVEFVHYVERVMDDAVEQDGHAETE